MPSSALLQKRLGPSAYASTWLPEEQKAMMADMAPLKRVALPEDVAGAVLAMASDHNRFVTGCYIPVSGGMLML